MRTAPLFRGQRGAQEENIISYRDDPTATIRTYIVENFLFSEDEGLDDDVSLLETGIIDSTGALELVVFLEDWRKKDWRERLAGKTGAERCGKDWRRAGGGKDRRSPAAQSAAQV